MSSLIYIAVVIVIAIFSNMNKAGKNKQKNAPRGGMPTFGGGGTLVLSAVPGSRNGTLRMKARPVRAAGFLFQASLPIRASLPCPMKSVSTILLLSGRSLLSGLLLTMMR